MDVNNALETALDPGPSPTGDPAALTGGARWRQRDARVEDGELPTDAEADADKDRDSDADANANANANADGGGGGGGGGRGREPPGTSLTQPEHAPRDAELWELVRRAQGAVVRLDFELRTAFIRQIFRRDFVFVSRQLHGLEASRRVQGLARGRLDDALDALRQRADAVQALLERMAADLQAAIDARAPANTRIAFARPARFQATIVSPAARRYLSLLTRADDTLARLEMAWLLGLVEPAHRTALASDCRRALNGFKDLACDRRQAVGSLVREINAQRRAITGTAQPD